MNKFGHGVGLIGFALLDATQAFSQTPSLPDSPPSTSPAQSTPSTKVRAKDSTAADLETRLKRMEEAYSRMERGNVQLRQEYQALQKKFDDVSRLLQESRAADAHTTAAPARTVSRSTTPSLPDPSIPPETQEPRLDRDLSATPESAPTVQPGASSAEMSGVGAQGRMGRESPGPFGLESAPAPEFESRMELISGGSRLDRAGAGAEGTGGRTSTRQQPTAAAEVLETKEKWVYRPDAGPPVHPSKIRCGEGLEFVSDDEDFRLQFHDLTQVDFRGFPKADQGTLQS